MNTKEKDNQFQWINLPEDYSNIFGFVYIIYNNHPESNKKWYIGCKQCHKRIKRKPLKGKKRNRIDYIDNDVEKYWGSSKELLEDIKKYGQEYFTREVIELCDSKFHMKYAELCYQILSGAIFNEKSYNGILSVRLRPPRNYKDNIIRDISKLNIDQS